VTKPKTTIRRLPERGVGDREVINAILDEGFLCHVGYLKDDFPIVIPTLYARDGDRVILHGSTASGITRAVRRNSPLSITVTLIDGLVVARSAFHSSANYRSVVIHGFGEILEGEEHRRALEITLRSLIPGREADIRASTDAELRQTASIEVPLTQVSAKVRAGPPGDDLQDLDDLSVWGGVVPLTLVAAAPIPDEHVEPETQLPDYLNPYRRSRSDEPHGDGDYQIGRDRNGTA
jgi:hypothetical protein